MQFYKLLSAKSYYLCGRACFSSILSTISVLPRPWFCDILAKKSKCHIHKHLGAPFVPYEFVWGQILNKCAVISPDKQNNDRKMSDCLSLTRRLFIYLCILNDHWILFLHSFTFKYVITNKTWLRESILKVNGDRHIFRPIKTHVVWKIEIITAIFSQT